MPHQPIKLTFNESNALRDALELYVERIGSEIIAPPRHRRIYALGVLNAIRRGESPDRYAAPMAIVASYHGSERINGDGSVNELWLGTRNRAIEKVCRFSGVEPVSDGKFLRVRIDEG